jgi:hypothetical protein
MSPLPGNGISFAAGADVIARWFEKLILWMLTLTDRQPVSSSILPLPNLIS